MLCNDRDIGRGQILDQKICGRKSGNTCTMFKRSEIDPYLVMEARRTQLRQHLQALYGSSEMRL